MKAWVLRSQGKPIRERLNFENFPDPVPHQGELLVKVSACALCRTDLHILEGDIPAHKLPLILGHQIVGRVFKVGKGVKKFRVGDRVGIPWLNSVDQSCDFCKKGLENLCSEGRFTGYDVDGGFAEYTIIKEDFAYALPEGPRDYDLTPLLCGGVIGYRAFRLAEVSPGGKLGLYGFGSSAHIILQLAVKKGIKVFVRSRGSSRLELAKTLGATWTGDYFSPLPEALHSVIIFAPAGEIVPLALKDVERGGRVILAGIHMTPIPSFPYQLIYQERMLKSVANSTRNDVKEFLEEAIQHQVKPEITLYKFQDLPQAFEDLSSGKLKGTGVILVKNA
ncbi:MAG: zinc-dependent alcohol dehydrogenase family protein [Caldiserica bacterium]|jgi:propanol-preferring alcohol dehydrogenase|nr:zinc-dependent alcohol dehydrogenase family protein [Caldisericota bacterium]MDH7562800.1 zinc-dependent alcohol dehydrogenase family protein [Caldisericota bacterium]